MGEPNLKKQLLLLWGDGKQHNSKTATVHGCKKGFKKRVFFTGLFE
jgi:hypothetical protein